MAQRDAVYGTFGPQLLEATVLVLLENINELRRNQGVGELSEQDLLESVTNHLTQLGPYDWMQE